MPRNNNQSKNKNKNKKIPLQQLLENLLAKSTNSTSSYTLLLEGSKHFQLRYLQQIDTGTKLNDHKVYHLASLLTPQEAARLDWQAGSCASLWLETILDILLDDILPPSTSDDTNQRIFWIQTIATTANKSSRSSRHHRDDQRRITVIDLSVNPWGWDTDNDDDIDADALERTIVAIDEQQQASTSFVLVESVTPLIMRYGMRKTCQFLHRIRRGRSGGNEEDRQKQHQHRHLIYPIQTEMWTLAQHRQFENSAANAIMSLQATTTTNQQQAASAYVQILRQGIREPSNLIRENVHFQIFDNDNDGDIRLELQSPPLDDDEDEDEDDITTTTATDPQQQRYGRVTTNNIGPEETAERIERSTDNTTTTTMGRQQHRNSKKGGVMPPLQVDEGARRITTQEPEQQQQQPRIFLQDDDPEFDDYDEEDPDDDLDI